MEGVGRGWVVCFRQAASILAGPYPYPVLRTGHGRLERQAPGVGLWLWLWAGRNTSVNHGRPAVGAGGPGLGGGRLVAFTRPDDDDVMWCGSSYQPPRRR